jgi:hypothetical protein
MNMTITNRNLEPGTRLVASYKKQTYVCTVEGEEGEGLAYVLGDGSRFKSPSSAAMKVMGGKAVNSWKFWSLEGDEPASLNAPTTATKKEGKTTRRGSRKSTYQVVHVDKSQADLAEGEVRWLCDACLKSFVLPAGQVPAECPNGHRNDDAELNQGAVATQNESE